MKPFLPIALLISLVITTVSSAFATTEATQFLPPEEAFELVLESADEQGVTIAFKVLPGHYLYADKLRISSDANIIIGTPVLPAAVQRHDTFSGKIKDTYPNDVQLFIPINGASSPYALNVKAQGCAEAGLCYPPFTQTLNVIPTLSGGSVNANSKMPAKSTVVQDESSRIGNMLSSGNYFLTLLSFFGFGLLLAFTPCVFPMIPILSSIIIGQGKSITKLRAFKLSAAYVVGMAVTYSLAGVAAGLSGTMLSVALQNVWVLSGFAMIFVILSLAMFDVYQLQLPASLQSKISRSAEQQKGGSFIGVTAMGALSALIVGPCIAAPLAGALLYIAQTGDAVLGGVALLCLALGMGTPLLFVGVAANSLLPKAGMWMNAVKKIFGVLLLAVAIWLVSPVVSPLILMLAIGALTIFCGIFLHALDPLASDAPTAKRLGKGLGVISVVVGLAMILGVLGGSRNPLQPLDFLAAKAIAAPGKATHSAAFKKIATLAQLNQSIKESNRPVLVDFYADWCVSCKEMDAFTFSDTLVKNRMERFTLLQVDVTENTAEHKAILKTFNVFGPPAVILLTPQNTEITRAIGFVAAPRFAETLAQIDEVSTARIDP